MRSQAPGRPLEPTRAELALASRFGWLSDTG
jgi:hypothetical protein